MFEEIDKETIELFQELANGQERDKILKIDVSKSFLFLPKFICPNLVGEDFELIRQSTLLMMVTQQDTAQSRMRLHELLVGDAGTGKTEFMLDWNEHFDGVFVNGEHASKAGLCGDARGSGTPGLLTTFTGNTICLHPDSRIIIDNKIDTISNFFAKKKIGNTISLDNFNIKKSNIKQISRHKHSKEMCTLKFDSGFELSVTPDHELLDGGNFEWKESSKFKKDEYVIAPLYIPSTKDWKYFLDIFPDETKMILYTEDKEELKKIIEKHYKNKSYVWREFKKDYGITSLFLWRSQKHPNSSIRLDVLRKILRDFGIYDEWKKKKYRVYNGSTTTLITTDRLTPEICYLVGFCVGDGWIQNGINYIIQSSVHKEQIERIRKYFKKIFDKDIHYYSFFQNKKNTAKGFTTSPNEQFKFALPKFFRLLYDYMIKNNFENILQLNNECLKGLFAGLIDSDGCIGIKNNGKYQIIHTELDLNLTKKEYQSLLLALRRFNVYGKIIENKRNKIKSIITTGRKDNLILINTLKKYSIKANKKAPKLKQNMRTQRDIAPLELVKDTTQYIYKNINTSILVERGLASTFDDYRKGLRKPNKTILKDIRKKLNGYLDEDTKRKIDEICSEEYFLDKIKEIKKEKYDGYVYDLTIPKYKNFIADGVIVHNCIDELDKTASKDQNALLQAMGEGQYTITKGKIHETFPAEVRVMASANKVNKIQSPLLDRFDFVYYLNRPARKERADTVPKIVDSFFGEVDKKKTKTVELYLKWIEDFKPEVVKDDLKVIYKFLQMYITDTHTDIDKISRRNLEYSILRIAYALAKLERKNISKEHMKQAILLKDKILSKYKMGQGHD